MPVVLDFPRIDTSELKLQIERKLGHQKAETYFELLTRFISLKISKCDFNKMCIATIGKENIHLHNGLLLSILKNAQFCKSPPSKRRRAETSCEKEVDGYEYGRAQSLCRDVPQSLHKPKMPDLRRWKSQDRPSPLGPLGKSPSVVYDESVQKVHEQGSATELHTFCSRPLGSVEEGEEVEQASGSVGIYSKSPIKAPLGVFPNTDWTRKIPNKKPRYGYHTETCLSNGGLPDSSSLKKRLEQKMEMEGLTISDDCANLLNKSLDVYLKRLIKPCMELANLRSKKVFRDQTDSHLIYGLNGKWPARCVQRASSSSLASMLDFQAAMEINPQVLGEDWPTQLEKIHSHASEE